MCIAMCKCIHTLSHVNKAHRQYFIHAIIINIYSFCWYWWMWNEYRDRGGMVTLWNLTKKAQTNSTPARCTHLLKYNILNTKLNDFDIFL